MGIASASPQAEARGTVHAIRTPVHKSMAVPIDRGGGETPRRLETANSNPNRC